MTDPNADTRKTFDQLVVHETAHALYKVPKYRKLMNKLAKKLAKKTREEVESLYGTTIKRQAFTSKEDVLKDEFAAHYLEYALGKEGMLARMHSPTQPLPLPMLRRVSSECAGALA